MAVPNLIGLLLLTPVVVSETKRYFEKDGEQTEKASGFSQSAVSQSEE
jgi:AGCS family alanine or glycine:cation symporter